MLDLLLCVTSANKLQYVYVFIPLCICKYVAQCTVPVIALYVAYRSNYIALSSVV